MGDGTAVPSPILCFTRPHEENDATARIARCDRTEYRIEVGAIH